MSPSTVSRWVGQVLAMAGINTEVFKAHSTRSASSSKAEVTGFSLTDIIKQGHWSQASIFQRFYRKNIKIHDSNFQSENLNKQLWREEVRVMSSIFRWERPSCRSVSGDFTQWNLGLYECKRCPKLSPDFGSEIGTSNLIIPTSLTQYLSCLLF